jgi:hypothetical protein
MSLTEGMITPEQKKKIHTLLSKHNIKDSEYRILLENKYQVSSSVYLDEEQASELIEYLIEVTGDTYDRDNNTEYYQKMQSEKKAEDRYIANVEYKNNLIKSTIHAFAETMTKEQILQLFLSITSNEQNKEIVQKMMN